MLWKPSPFIVLRVGLAKGATQVSLFSWFQLIFGPVIQLKGRFEPQHKKFPEHFMQGSCQSGHLGSPLFSLRVCDESKVFLGVWHQECFRSDHWFFANGSVSFRVTNVLRRGQALLQEPSPVFPPKASLSFIQGNGKLCLNLTAWDLRATLETWAFCFPCFSHGCGCWHLCLWGMMGSLVSQDLQGHRAWSCRGEPC